MEEDAQAYEDGLVNTTTAKRCEMCPGGWRQESPIVIRTRFMNQFVNIQDLQAQLYRDASQSDDYATKEYIQELIDRLEKLKR